MLVPSGWPYVFCQHCLLFPSQIFSQHKPIFFQNFSSTFFPFSIPYFSLLDLPTRKELNVTRMCLGASEQPVTYTLDRFTNSWERDKIEWGSLTLCHTTRLVRLGVSKHHGFNQKHKPFCSIAGLSMVPFSLLMFFSSIPSCCQGDQRGVRGSRILCNRVVLALVCLKLQFPTLLTGSTLPTCSWNNPSLAADMH